MKINKGNSSRRAFIKQGSLAGLGMAMSSSMLANMTIKSSPELPAILGGKPIHPTNWPTWPYWDPAADEPGVLASLRSGVWSRDKIVDEFEKKWAETVGAKGCLALVNGTNAMITSLIQLGIGGGDEVIIPPYTYISTAAAVLATGAIPVFADIDPTTFQIDPKRIEEKITQKTRAILPVHICGLPADMEAIMLIAKKHNLFVVEDACQAQLAEINHQNVGTFGDAGCFSFQNSKNIPMGEGGAIVSNDMEFIDRCYSYHNLGWSHGSVKGEGYILAGTKLRIAEYQAAIGLAQLKRLEGQTLIRNTNGAYLKEKLAKIPGIEPYRLYPNVTRVALHLFPFRYKSAEFNGLSRDVFIQAVNAEGVYCESGYTPLNTMPYIENAFKSKNFQKMYSNEELDINRYNASNKCPENDKICNEEAVWFPQNMLLAGKADMNAIVTTIEKVKEYAGKIKDKIH